MREPVDKAVASPLTETKEQERHRLLTEVYAAEQLYAHARRAQEWELASRLAAETARIAKLLSLCEQGRE